MRMGLSPSYFLERADAAVSQPAWQSHDLDNGNRFCFIAGSIQTDLTDGSGNIFGSTSETGGVVSQDQIIVNGLGNTDETNAAFVSLGSTGELTDGIHGIISTDV